MYTKTLAAVAAVAGIAAAAPYSYSSSTDCPPESYPTGGSQYPYSNGTSTTYDQPSSTGYGYGSGTGYYSSPTPYNTYTPSSSTGYGYDSSSSSTPYNTYTPPASTGYGYEPSSSSTPYDTYTPPSSTGYGYESSSSSPAPYSTYTPPTSYTPPTTTTGGNAPSTTVALTGVTHSVVAGLGTAPNNLNFDPDNVSANPGDIVEFLFLPRNHSVAQSSFDDPCKPLADGTGFFAGFQFETDNNLADDVFQIVVQDTKPIWYYCPQTNGNHCQKGMAGVINQDYSSTTKTLANYKAAAALTGMSVVPNVIQGGTVEANPNPGSGF